jgi:polar amino acid transport system substrate-binding protein
MNPSQFPPSRAFSFCFLGILSFVFNMACPTVRSLAEEQTQSVVLSVEDDASPWSRPDGSGYANDLVVAAYRAVGVEVDLKVVPYARCKKMAINGEVAGCFSTSPSPELRGLIQLSDQPLFSVTSGYFYNVNKPPIVNRQENLAAETIVGTVIGYEYPASFEQLKEQKKLLVEPSPSEDVNLRKLAAGRIDLALLNYNEMKSPEWLMKRAGVTGQVKIGFEAGLMNSYIAFSTKHPEGAWAREQFNKGFSIIRTNGTLHRIKKTWMRLIN